MLVESMKKNIKDRLQKLLRNIFFSQSTLADSLLRFIDSIAGENCCAIMGLLRSEKFFRYSRKNRTRSETYMLVFENSRIDSDTLNRNKLPYINSPIIAALMVLFSFDMYAATFVSLKSSEINLRVGPGKEYPIVWIIMKRNLPVILVAEFDQWRKVKFFDGVEGWVHKNMISGRNMIIVTGDNTIMYKYASHSYPMAKVEKNVVMKVLKKDGDWIKVEINMWKGWIERKNVWGVDDS